MSYETIEDFPGDRAVSGRRTRCRPARERKPRLQETTAMLYLAPLGTAEPGLQFCSFDATYVNNLRVGDPSTQEHFVGYFGALIQLKLRSRLKSPQDIEDVRQETFFRVLKALSKEGTLREPGRLGAFVNTVCNNVLFEQYRSSGRTESLDEEGQPEPQATGGDAFEITSAAQIKEKVREILLSLPERDRALIKAVFIDERDRDEVCRELGVEREYLRVLLHRAKLEFKAEYLKQNGSQFPPGINPQRT